MHLSPAILQVRILPVSWPGMVLLLALDALQSTPAKAASWFPVPSRMPSCTNQGGFHSFFSNSFFLFSQDVINPHPYPQVETFLCVSIIFILTFPLLVLFRHTRLKHKMPIFFPTEKHYFPSTLPSFSSQSPKPMC